MRQLVPEDLESAEVLPRREDLGNVALGLRVNQHLLRKGTLREEAKGVHGVLVMHLHLGRLVAQRERLQPICDRVNAISPDLNFPGLIATRYGPFITLLPLSASILSLSNLELSSVASRPKSLCGLYDFHLVAFRHEYDVCVIYYPWLSRAALSRTAARRDFCV